MKQTNKKKSTVSTTSAPGKCIRYSDSELKEFKEIILHRLSEATTDYELLKGSISGQYTNGTDDTSPSFKLGEDVPDLSSREEMAQLAIRRQKYIEQLRNALIRIENRTYGICRVSGQLISKERLRSVPHTTISIDAKLTAAGAA
jgi:DnaK suppressor protein